MHTEIYCTSLDSLDRVKAIRAIHQAYLQLAIRHSRTAGSLNNDPTARVLAACLADAGHPGFVI